MYPIHTFGHLQRPCHAADPDKGSCRYRCRGCVGLIGPERVLEGFTNHDGGYSSVCSAEFRGESLEERRDQIHSCFSGVVQRRIKSPILDAVAISTLFSGVEEKNFPLKHTQTYTSSCIAFGKFQPAKMLAEAMHHKVARVLLPIRLYIWAASWVSLVLGTHGLICTCIATK